jgi:hypothetical protein
MNQKTRQEAIELLNKIKIGKLTRIEITADYVVSTFHDLMKISSIPDKELEGKSIIFKDPMKSYLSQFDE